MNESLIKCFIPGYEAFSYVLYVGFYAQRNLCDKQNVLFYGTPRIFEPGLSRNDCEKILKIHFSGSFQTFSRKKSKF